MAIYKNREVTVTGPNSQANTNETITVQYKDGTHENVSLGLVKFTEQEKKDFQKRYPSQYDNVETITDKDLEAVRVGVTPPSDPSWKETAEVQVQREKQQQLMQKNLEVAKADAQKNLDQKLSADKTASSRPTGSVAAPVQPKYANKPENK